MKQHLKVEFVDTSASQYEENASRIDVPNKKAKNGKLYLGDRFSATYLQLKHRSCSTVVNCSSSIISLSREPNVKYLNIDIEENISSLGKSADFIENELNQKHNVVVHCETGNGKSAAVLMYYFMAKHSMCLGDSYDLVKLNRPSVKPSPTLMELLIQQEMKIFGSVSVRLDGRNVIHLNRARSPSKPALSKNMKYANQKNSNTAIMVGVGLLAFFVGVFGIIYATTGKI